MNEGDGEVVEVEFEAEDEDVAEGVDVGDTRGLLPTT